MRQLLFITNDDESVRKLSQRIEELNSLHKDKQVEYLISFDRNRNIRSNNQNRYYRAILKHIASAGECGYAEDELHEMYKQKFNSRYIIDEQVGQSTGKLTTEEFTIYVNKVKKHAEDFYHVTFPDPKDKVYQQWEEQTNKNYDRMFSQL